MPGLRFRLFGAGKLPSAIRDEVERESVLFRTDGIRVVVHRHGRVPGARDARGVSASLGSFAVTDRRVVGARGRGKLVDMPYEAAAREGPATLRLNADGLHVRFDLDRVHPSCHGVLRVEFRQPMTEGSSPRFAPGSALSASIRRRLFGCSAASRSCRKSHHRLDRGRAWWCGPLLCDPPGGLMLLAWVGAGWLLP
jgi:hypothetical protein